MTEPTPDMTRQMKINCRYLAKCHGWSKEDCIFLAQEYRKHIQTPEGFETIRAHLESIMSYIEEQLQIRNDS